MKLGFIIASIFLLACIPTEPTSKQQNSSNSYQLPKFLNEISALAYADKKLYTLQDEDGIIYLSGTDSIDFKPYLNLQKSGDFEGLTIVNGAFYALKSNGTIYKVGADKEIKKYKFPSDDNDFEFEGIAFDRIGEQLLIACKKHGKKAKNDKVWIYAFSLKKKIYKEDPFIKIDKEDLGDVFAASGIALDKEGFIYLISAKKALLAKFSRAGKVLALVRLDQKKYPQIEGVVIDDEDRLWLASEKNDMKHATLFTFAKP